MIKRIVKMTFREEAVPEYLQLFKETKRQTRAFEGCRHLELLKSVEKPNILISITHWKTVEALDNYRESDFFQDTWQKTMALLAKRPRAWSVELLFEMR